MWLTCSLQTFAGHERHDALASVRAAGLQYVDVRVGSREDTVGWAPPTSLRTADDDQSAQRIWWAMPTLQVPDEAWVAGWEAALEHHGLGVGILELACDPQQDAGTDSTVPEHLPIAQRLVARHVLVSIDEPLVEEAAHQTRLDQLRRWGDAAGELGIRLCLAAQPGSYWDSRSMGQMMDRLDHPAVGLCFDTGGYLDDNPGANGEVALQRVLGHVACLRLSDFDECSVPGGFPPLGLGGGVDFARTLQIMQAVEFPGPCSIYFTPPERSPSDALPQIRQNLRDSVELLRDCGWLDDAHRYSS